MGSRRYLYLAVFLYVVIIGHSFLFTKIALRAAGPLEILAHRFSAAFVGMLIPLLAGWVKVSYSAERIKKIIPLAIFYPLLFFGFQTSGIQYSSTSEAGIISALSPVFTLVLAAYFLKEKSSILQKLSITLSVLGVIYIAVMKGASLDAQNALGITFLLLACLAIAGYNVLGRKLTQTFSNIELSVIMITISFIVFNVVAVVKNLLAGNIRAFFAPLSDMSFVISIVYLGVLSSLVTSLMTNYVLSKMEASRMGVFVNLGTVVTIIAGIMFLKEEFYYYHVIGSILVIGGVLGANYLKRIS